MLRIKDLHFEIADATLEATLKDGRLLWSVNIESAEREVAGEYWQPKAYLDLYAAPTRSSRELIQYGWHIPSARDLGGGTILPGQSNCCLYVFEHDFLENSRLRFSVGEDGLALSWSGECSVHWDEEYGVGLDFLAETKIEFLGFYVPAETEDDARRAMASVFDLTGLVYYQEPGQKGSFFLPRTDAWPSA